MKFQISFDFTDLEKAIEVGRKVAEYADILEISSLSIQKYGTQSVEMFKKEFPEKILLADAKIVDRGRDTAALFASAGANWITVMAGTSKEVIHATCTRAHDLKTKVALDLLDSSSQAQSALEAQSLGADAILFHQPYDEAQSPVFMDQWEMIRGNSSLPIFVSAKITRDTIDEILALKPNGIIIGKTITEAENPEEEAKFFAEKCRAAS